MKKFMMFLMLVLLVSFSSITFADEPQIKPFGDYVWGESFYQSAEKICINPELRIIKFMGELYKDTDVFCNAVQAKEVNFFVNKMSMLSLIEPYDTKFNEVILSNATENTLTYRNINIAGMDFGVYLRFSGIDNDYSAYEYINNKENHFNFNTTIFQFPKNQEFIVPMVLTVVTLKCKSPVIESSVRNIIASLNKKYQQYKISEDEGESYIICHYESPDGISLHLNLRKNSIKPDLTITYDARNYLRQLHTGFIQSVLEKTKNNKNDKLDNL